MQTNLANEIADKLHLSVEAVNKSDAIKNTFMQIKNDPQLSESEKESMYKEMAAIYQNMVNAANQS